MHAVHTIMAAAHPAAHSSFQWTPAVLTVVIILAVIVVLAIFIFGAGVPWWAAILILIFGILVAATPKFGMPILTQLHHLTKGKLG